MVAGGPPRVAPAEYERRVLAALRKTVWHSHAISVADVWLEGEHPDTQVVVVLKIENAPAGRYIYRDDLWKTSTDSNPEMHVAAIHLTIMESSPWGLRRGRRPGWIHEPRPPRPGVAVRRPDLEPRASETAPGPIAPRTESLPWPRPAQADPDLYERCLLAVFHGEWPGYRGHIEDAWLEHDYPATMIAFDLRLRDFAVRRVVFRAPVWRQGPLPPGVEWQNWSAGEIIGQLVEWQYFTRKAGTQQEFAEPRPADPGVARRRPTLPQPRATRH